MGWGTDKWHVAWELPLRSICLVFAVGLLAAETLATETPNSTTAEGLVTQALQAEASGDAARRADLLGKAIEMDPAYPPARWHLGQIKVDGKWQPLEEAQRSAAANPRIAEYRRLREAHGDSPMGQLVLARWCRRHNLDDESRLHWASVLSFQPDNEEALRALGVRWFRGQLLTYDQIDEAKQQLSDARWAAREWPTRIAGWERALSKTNNTSEREEALDEIRQISSVVAIPELEEVTLDPGSVDARKVDWVRPLSMAFVDALAGMTDHAATESLVRHAVLAPIEAVRSAATDRLKERPLHDYVPLLLDGLAMPIESSFRVTTDSDGSVHYRHQLYRQGANMDWSLDGIWSAWQQDLRGHVYLKSRDGRIQDTGRPSESDARVAAKIASNASRHQRGFQREASVVQQQVAQVNQSTAALNERIYPVLANTTGNDLGENPNSWWDWWQDDNEYYSGEYRPVYEQEIVESRYHYYRMPTVASNPSCFAKGTNVWTKTGLRPIESLVIGDLVLSQDPDTGELAYKPVLGTTVRPPTSILKLTLGTNELRTTLGHPMWVSGAGWQMAKKFKTGAILHGVKGPVSVDSIQETGEAEAYNLIVADWSTYFVGESGVLVHDNTPRRPTLSIVPGFADAMTGQ